MQCARSSALPQSLHDACQTAAARIHARHAPKPCARRVEDVHPAARCPTCALRRRARIARAVRPARRGSSGACRLRPDPASGSDAGGLSAIRKRCRRAASRRAVARPRRSGRASRRRFAGWPRNRAAAGGCAAHARVPRRRSASGLSAAARPGPRRSACELVELHAAGSREILQIEPVVAPRQRRLTINDFSCALPPWRADRKPGRAPSVRTRPSPCRSLAGGSTISSTT